jgi:hypothetical protein
LSAYHVKHTFLTILKRKPFQVNGVDVMSHVTIHPKRFRWMKNPQDVVSGLKHDNRLKCHRGIVSQWTFQVGLNVTVDETWMDVTSRHHIFLAHTSQIAAMQNQ